MKHTGNAEKLARMLCGCRCANVALEFPTEDTEIKEVEAEIFKLPLALASGKRQKSGRALAQ
jgi:hypothetical protein